MKTTRSKVAIVGCGNVGSSFAFALMNSGLARDIVLVDRNAERAQGECMDLSHGASFVPPVSIKSSGYEGCRGADVVVLTLGAKQEPGQTRLDLAKTNAEIYKEVIPLVAKHAKDAILLIVTNPVDVLTHLTLKITGFPVNQVMGSGTVLDSSRFRYQISEYCHVDPRNIHAYIIGEHGDTELPVLSHANIGGMLLGQYCPICNSSCDYKKELTNIFKDVKDVAYRIIEAKGATYYAIALALVKIVEAILRDENSVLPVSTLISGYYGIKDVCLSMPSIVNRKGVQKFLKLELSYDEEQKLKKSAKAVKNAIDSVGV